jgi:hypothetical protein
MEDAGEPLLTRAKRLLGANSARGLDDRNQHAANAGRGVFVWNRTVTESEPAIFPIGRTASLDWNKQIFGEERATCPLKDRLVQQLELGLDFWPCLMKRKAKCRWMLIAEDRAVAIVINHDKLRPPPNTHGKARGEHHFDDDR